MSHTLHTSSRSAEPSLHPHHARELLGRGVGVVGLAAIALIHLLDLPGKFKETVYVGWLYVGLIAAAVTLATFLLTGRTGIAWKGAVILAAGAIASYCVSRSVGLPGATNDIGNWLEPLGLAALFAEIGVFALGLHGLRLARAQR